MGTVHHTISPRTEMSSPDALSTVTSPRMRRLRRPRQTIFVVMRIQPIFAQDGSCSTSLPDVNRKRERHSSKYLHHLYSGIATGLVISYSVRDLSDSHRRDHKTTYS